MVLLLISLAHSVFGTLNLPEIGIQEFTYAGSDFKLEPPLKSAFGSGTPPVYATESLGSTETIPYAFVGCYSMPNTFSSICDSSEGYFCGPVLVSLFDPTACTIKCNSLGFKVSAIQNQSCFCVGVVDSLLKLDTDTDCTFACFWSSPTYLFYSSLNDTVVARRFCGGPSSAVSVYSKIASVSPLAKGDIDHIRQIYWHVVNVFSPEGLSVLHATSYSSGLPLFMYDYPLIDEFGSFYSLLGLHVDVFSSLIIGQRVSFQRAFEENPVLVVFVVDTKVRQGTRVSISKVIENIDWGEDCLITVDRSILAIDSVSGIDPVNKVYYMTASSGGGLRDVGSGGGSILWGFFYGNSLEISSGTACLRFCFLEKILAISSNFQTGEISMLLNRLAKGTWLVSLGKMTTLYSNSSSTESVDGNSSDGGSCQFVPSVLIKSSSLTTCVSGTSDRLAVCLPVFDENFNLDSISVLSDPYLVNSLKSKIFSLGNLAIDHLNYRACTGWSAEDRTSSTWQLTCASDTRGLEASYSLKHGPSWWNMVLTDPGIPKQAPRPFFSSAQWESSGQYVKIKINQATLRGAILIDSNGDFIPDGIDKTRQCPITSKTNPPATECPCLVVFDDKTLNLIGSNVIYCAFRSASLVDIRIKYPELIRSDDFAADAVVKLSSRSDSIYSFLDNMYSQAMSSDILVTTPVCDPTKLYPQIVGSPLPARGFPVIQDLCGGTIVNYCSSGNTGGIQLFSWSVKDYGRIGQSFKDKLDSVIARANSEKGKNDGASEYRVGACMLNLTSDNIEPGRTVVVSVSLQGRWCPNLKSSFDLTISKQSVPAPTVRIVPPAAIMTTDENVFHADATASSCADDFSSSTGALLYQWSIVPYLNYSTNTKGDPVVMVPGYTFNADSSELTIMRQSLLPAQVYLIGVKVGYANTWPSGASSTFTDVRVPRGPIACNCIVTSRSIEDLAVIDCSSSLDRDFPSRIPLLDASFDFSLLCARPDDIPCLPRISSNSTTLFTGIPSCEYSKSSTSVNSQLMEIGGVRYTPPKFAESRESLSAYICQNTDSTKNDLGLVFMSGALRWPETQYFLSVFASSYGRTCQVDFSFNRTAVATLKPNIKVSLSGVSSAGAVSVSKSLYVDASCLNCLLPATAQGGSSDRMNSGCAWTLSVETLGATAWLPFDLATVKTTTSQEGSLTQSITGQVVPNSLIPDSQYRIVACCRASNKDACSTSEFETSPNHPEISFLDVSPSVGNASLCRDIQWNAASPVAFSCKIMSKDPAASAAQFSPLTSQSLTDNSYTTCYLPVGSGFDSEIDVCLTCCDIYDGCISSCTLVQSTLPENRTAWTLLIDEIGKAGQGSSRLGFLNSILASWGPQPPESSQSESEKRLAASQLVSDVADNFLKSVNSKDPSHLSMSEISRGAATMASLTFLQTNVISSSGKAAMSLAATKLVEIGSSLVSSIKLSLKNSNGIGVKEETEMAISSAFGAVDGAFQLNSVLNSGKRRLLLAEDEVSLFMEEFEVTEYEKARSLLLQRRANDTQKELDISSEIAIIQKIPGFGERMTQLEAYKDLLSFEDAELADALYSRSLIANSFTKLLVDLSGSVSSLMSVSDDDRLLNLSSVTVRIGRTADVRNPHSTLEIDGILSDSLGQIGFSVSNFSLDHWSHLQSNPPGPFKLISMEIFDDYGERIQLDGESAPLRLISEKSFSRGYCAWLNTGAEDNLGKWETDGLVNNGNGCDALQLKSSVGLIGMFLDLEEPNYSLTETKYYRDTKTLMEILSVVVISVIVISLSTIVMSIFLAIQRDKRDAADQVAPYFIGDGISSALSPADPVYYSGSSSFFVTLIFTFANLLKRDHLLVSCFYSDPLLKTRRVHRVIVFFTAMIACISVPSIVYGSSPASDFVLNLHFVECGIFSAFAIFPVICCLSLMFTVRPFQPLFPQGRKKDDIAAISSFSSANPGNTSRNIVTPPSPQILAKNESPLSPRPPSTPPPPIIVPSLLPVNSQHLISPTSKSSRLGGASDVIKALEQLPFSASDDFPEPQPPTNSLVSALPLTVDLEIDHYDLTQRVRRSYVNQLLAKSGDARGEQFANNHHKSTPENAEGRGDVHASPVSFLAEAITISCAILLSCAFLAINIIYAKSFSVTMSVEWIEAAGVAAAILLIPIEVVKALFRLFIEITKLLARIRRKEGRSLEKRIIADRRKASDNKFERIGPIKRPRSPPRPPSPLPIVIPRPPPTPVVPYGGGLSFLDLPPTPRVNIVNT